MVAPAAMQSVTADRAGALWLSPASVVPVAVLGQPAPGRSVGQSPSSAARVASLTLADWVSRSLRAAVAVELQTVPVGMAVTELVAVAQERVVSAERAAPVALAGPEARSCSRLRRAPSPTIRAAARKMRAGGARARPPPIKI